MTDLHSPCPSVIVADSHPARIRCISDRLILLNLNPIAVTDAEQFESAVSLSNPALIIIDSAFSEFGGVSLCTEIRSRKKLNHCAVILLIPAHEPHLRTVGFKAGMNDYLLTPVCEHELSVKFSTIAARIYGDERVRNAAADASRMYTAILMEWYAGFSYCAASTAYAVQRLPEQQPAHDVCAHIRSRIDEIFSALYEGITLERLRTLTIYHDKKRCDVTQLLARYCDRYIALSRMAHIPLEWNCTAHQLYAFANESLIGSVLDFLLLNAFKVTPADGRVSLEVSTDYDTMFIHIKDFGSGMNDQVKDRLFVPYRENGKKAKWALGLFLTEKIIAFHNGKLFVETMPDDGSTFTFSLPLFHDIK